MNVPIYPDYHNIQYKFRLLHNDKDVPWEYRSIRVHNSERLLDVNPFFNSHLDDINNIMWYALYLVVLWILTLKSNILYENTDRYIYTEIKNQTHLYIISIWLHNPLLVTKYPNAKTHRLICQEITDLSHFISACYTISYQEEKQQQYVPIFLFTSPICTDYVYSIQYRVLLFTTGCKYYMFTIMECKTNLPYRYILT